MEGATRKEGELMKDYFHRIKQAVDRAWPENIPARITNPAQTATRENNAVKTKKTKVH